MIIQISKKKSGKNEENQIQLIRSDAPQNSPSLPLKKKHTKYFFHTLR
jgi:hypothetical protein